ncbi:MAG: type I citrate synthase [Acidobacteria bacterium CG_4_9_14_3_um_filter_49_7]|nr:MAG: type I citrate synthase [Acidobacteria bacterium CG_4_9_14_3_um_filter_49_7]
MSLLKQKLASMMAKEREDFKSLKGLGDKVIDHVRVDQALGGIRGVKVLICDTSYLDPMEGIRFRGMTIPETRKALPKKEGVEEPYALGIWWLLLTGEIPTLEEVLDLEAEVKAKAQLPQYIIDVLRALPQDAHPMAMFTTAIAALEGESAFRKRYNEGMTKADYWEPTLEDSINLLAKLPLIASYIYRLKYKNDDHIPANPNEDWGGNFAHMMGVDNPEYKDLMRLYLLLHSDHESGNVSAHTGHLVSSALSDVFYSVSAAMGGLAGPLHGLANQECLKWILDLMDHFGGRTPTKEEIEKYAWDTLNSGQVIPGYGHAVLRQTDPRYAAQRGFALKHLPDDPIFKTVSNVYEVIPGILEKQGKAKNPWPNVDAHSGVLQVYYGVKEYDFYTVLFGVSRAMGITSQLVWDRALGYPIERPKSITRKMLKKLAEEAN